MCIIGRNQGRDQAIDGAVRGMRYEITDIDMAMEMNRRGEEYGNTWMETPTRRPSEGQL
jgi:hypothetical protein